MVWFAVVSLSSVFKLKVKKKSAAYLVHEPLAGHSGCVRVLGTEHEVSLWG